MCQLQLLLLLLILLELLQHITLLRTASATATATATATAVTTCINVPFETYSPTLHFAKVTFQLLTAYRITTAYFQTFCLCILKLSNAILCHTQHMTTLVLAI